MKIFVIILLCISNFLVIESSTEESVEFSEESDESGSSGSSISFEIQATNEKSIESEESNENSGSKEVANSEVIDNDQVFCTWEDLNARDKMATKLGTELCRFSMVS